MRGDDPRMTPPAPTTRSASRRLVLVPVADRSDHVVRRYRLARLKLEERAIQDRAERFAHVRRSYD
jgi:hypothetical protein